jgi:hypothetical protein
MSSISEPIPSECFKWSNQGSPSNRNIPYDEDIRSACLRFVGAPELRKEHFEGVHRTGVAIIDIWVMQVGIIGGSWLSAQLCHAVSATRTVSEQTWSKLMRDIAKKLYKNATTEKIDLLKLLKKHEEQRLHREELYELKLEEQLQASGIIYLITVLQRW